MGVREEIFRPEPALVRIVETMEDGRFVDSYLLLGEEGALLIDTQRCENDLPALVRSLTDKPLQVLITHAHPDHLGPAARQFLLQGVPIWIFQEELEPHADLIHGAFPEAFAEGSSLRFLEEGQCFDIGGIKIEVLSLTGHTPRAALFLERERGWLFSGDAMGNRSFWMQVYGAKSLEAFAEEMRSTLQKLREIPGLAIFTGHGIGTERYDADWAEDVLRVTEDILGGQAAGSPVGGFAPDTLRLETPVFPEGYFYRSENLHE